MSDDIKTTLWGIAIGAVLTIISIGTALWQGWIGKSTRDDARKWHEQEERRRADEVVVAEETRRRESLALQYDVDLRDALDVINKLQDIACLVITRVDVLGDMREVRDLAYRAGQIGARLPAEMRSLLDGEDGSSAVNSRAYQFANTGFTPVAGMAPLAAAAAGIDQYRAAHELDEALGLARERVRAVLGRRAPNPVAA